MNAQHAVSVAAGSRRLLPVLLFGLTATFQVVVGTVHAQAPPAVRPAPGDEAPGKDDLRQAAIEWLDRYLSDQVLLDKQDLAQIWEKVSQMTPSQLKQWTAETKKLREFIESDQWQETNRWLKEFLRVQAMYSDEEVAALKKRIAAADPNEVLEILGDIQKKHQSFRSLHRSSERNRATALKARDAMAKQQAAAAKATGRAYSSNRPLFGSTQGHAARRASSRGYRVPAPLVTSRGVARAAVRRQVFPGYYRGW